MFVRPIPDPCEQLSGPGVGSGLRMDPGEPLFLGLEL